MPQIWLTYNEVGEWLACGEARAASFATAAGWSRRRCSDGLSRVKLPPPVMHAFLRNAQVLDGCGDSIRDEGGTSLTARDAESLPEFAPLRRLALSL